MIRRRRTIVAARPAAHAAPAAQIQGVTGWRPFSAVGMHPSEQIGAYNGTVLTQYPVNLPGVQRHCGVESLRSGWYTPTRSVVPLPERQTVQAPTRLIAGPQRSGAIRGAPSGPVTAGVMMANVWQAAQQQGAGTIPLPIFLSAHDIGSD